MRTLILGILSLVWLTGCQSDDGEMAGVKFGKTFQLGSQDEVFLTVQPAADSLKVMVDSISDSRCPEGAQCIWAGNAEVKLSLSKEKETQLLTLCIGDCRSGDRTGFIEQDTASVTLGGQGFQVILKDVVPYPNLDNPPTQQEAVLEINEE
uniref:Lipoprotein n=1 Tax=Roseihalotalea indica TaxID=2867963 RepID=A0AA49GUA8_9BACT|nr:hypothetical protein K4G66_13335 [Tunicatimonas sp. TK19036]